MADEAHRPCAQRRREGGDVLGVPLRAVAAAPAVPALGPVAAEAHRDSAVAARERPHLRRPEPQVGERPVHEEQRSPRPLLDVGHLVAVDPQEPHRCLPPRCERGRRARDAPRTAAGAACAILVMRVGRASARFGHRRLTRTPHPWPRTPSCPNRPARTGSVPASQNREAALRPGRPRDTGRERRRLRRRPGNRLRASAAWERAGPGPLLRGRGKDRRRPAAATSVTPVVPSRTGMPRVRTHAVAPAPAIRQKAGPRVSIFAPLRRKKVLLCQVRCPPEADLCRM